MILMIFMQAYIYFSKSPINGDGDLFRYVLVNIDIFSKYLWCYFMQHKTSDEIIDCYRRIFQDRKPRKIWFDQERSVFSRKSQAFFIENNVIYIIPIVKLHHR